MRIGHVVVTVGWLGSVAAFLALTVAGLASAGDQIVRASYLAMDLIARFVIVPLSIIPLSLTGPLLSQGTPWGLFRHYWILVKLVINLLSTAILLVHLRLIRYMARVAMEETLSTSDRPIQIQLLVAAAAGLWALLVATGLAVYKPRGLTAYGWRKQHREHTESAVYNSTL